MGFEGNGRGDELGGYAIGEDAEGIFRFGEAGREISAVMVVEFLEIGWVAIDRTINSEVVAKYLLGDALFIP